MLNIDLNKVGIAGGRESGNVRHTISILVTEDTNIGHLCQFQTKKIATGETSQDITSFTISASLAS